MRTLGLKITEAFDRISKITGKDLSAEIDQINLSEFMRVYGDALFREIAGIWNWLFGFGAAALEEKYEPVTEEWLQDSVTISMLRDLLREIAEQNSMGWLIPFFKSRIAQVGRAMIGNGKTPAPKG